MNKLTISILLISMAVLIGCTTPNTVSISADERRGLDVISSDKAIEDKAKEKITEIEGLGTQAHVSINTFNGAVLVTGEVPNQTLKNKVIEEIRIIPQVKIVHDNLVIARPSSTDSRSNDGLITDEVKTALTEVHTLPGFDPSLIKVVTENGAVYLMGLVHAEEGTVVINLARLQPGVKKIITVFEYID